MHSVLRSVALSAAGILLAATPGLAQQGPQPGVDAVVPASPTAAEVEVLRGEVEALRSVVERQERLLVALEERLRSLGPAAPAVEVAPATSTAPDADAVTQTGTATAAPAADTVAKQVEGLMRTWGRLRFAGDLQMRYEGFYTQGLDAPVEAPARNRVRVRLRAQLSGDIGENFDWGFRLASGSFDNPGGVQQSFSEFYNRKAIGIDRAYIHFNTKTKPAELELWMGKFEAPWKRTSVTFDEDLQPEGMAETFAVEISKDAPLRSMKLVAWQLPYRERAIGADAVLFGGQVQTEWRLSDAWSATVAGAFHDFEQVDVIPLATGVSPTLVNAGFDFGTTNTVVVNPFTNLPEYRSEFRVIDTIAELRYTGFGDSGRWPLVLRANWIHNTSAFNNQKDGGQAEVILGRRQEQGDWSFDYVFWKTEREVFPSVFMDSEFFIQTNNLTHAVRGRYSLRKAVEFTLRYFAHRRLQTVAPENRWLNHIQFDIQYRF